MWHSPANRRRFFDLDDTIWSDIEFMRYAPDDDNTQDTTPLCQFTAGYLSRSQLSNVFSTVGDEIWERATMAKFYWDPVTKKVDHIYVDFLSFFFESIDTSNSAALVCAALLSGDDGQCMAAAAASSVANLPECVAQFMVLPLAESDDIYLDGNTKSCRFIHGVLAQVNRFHCPHLSFEPLEDGAAHIKCQQSSTVDPFALFTFDDFMFWRRFKRQAGFRHDGTSIHQVGKIGDMTRPRGFYFVDGNVLHPRRQCKSLCRRHYVLDQTAGVPICVRRPAKKRKEVKTGHSKKESRGAKKGKRHV